MKYITSELNLLIHALLSCLKDNRGDYIHNKCEWHEIITVAAHG